MKKVKDEMTVTSDDFITNPVYALDHDFGTVFETSVVDRPYLQIDMSEPLVVMGVDVHYEMAGRAQYTNGDVWVYLSENSVDMVAISRDLDSCCYLFDMKTAAADAVTRLVGGREMIVNCKKTVGVAVHCSRYPTRHTPCTRRHVLEA